jgi:hypothetical protein
MKKLEGSGCGLLSDVSMQFGRRNKGNPIELLPIQGSQWCSPWLWPWFQVVFLNLSPFQPVHVPHPHLVMTLCCVIVVPGPQAALFVHILWCTCFLFPVMLLLSAFLFFLSLYAYSAQKRHHLLMSTHPSPLSAHRGFLGCGHFSRCNELLKEHGEKPIDWGDLPEK